MGDYQLFLFLTRIVRSPLPLPMLSSSIRLLTGSEVINA